MKDSNQSLSQRVIKGSFIALTLTFIGSVLAYLIRVFYSRTLSVEDYGLFYAIFGLIGLITTYSDLGFGYSIAYLIPKHIRLKEYNIVWNIFIYGITFPFILSIAVSLGLIAAAPFLAASYFKVPGSENLIYIFCIYLMSFTLMNSLIQIYSGLQKEKYYSSITIFRWFLTLFFSLTLFLFNIPGIIYFAFSIGLAHLVTSLIFIALFYKKFSFITLNKITWNVKLIKKMFHLATPTLLTTFISSFAVYSDLFFLTLFKGVKDVGVYNVIFPLASVSIVLLTPIHNLLLPLVSHLAEDEKTKVGWLVDKILEITPFIGAYFSLFLILFPSTSIRLVFGNNWIGLAELPLSIIAFGVISIPLANLLGTVSLGLGKARERLKIFIVISILSVLLNAVFTYYWGIIGVTISHSIIFFIQVILFLVIIRSSSINFRLPWFFYSKLFLMALSVFVIIRWTGFNPQSWFGYIITGVVYTLGFAGIGYYLKVYDNALIKELLKR